MPHPDSKTVAELLRQSLSQGKQPVLRIKSDSMSPLLRRGDEVRVGPSTATSLTPGDVIVVWTPVDLLTHRYWCTIVDGEETFLVTRGDRPLGFDRPHPVDSLVGIVVSRQRRRRVLSLESGRGRRLNQTLSCLAAREARLFNVPVPVVGSDTSPPKVNLTRRVLRRLLFLLARALMLPEW